MAMKKFLYWFRDNPERKVETDVDWAIERFKFRFNYDPSLLLVNPDEIDYFSNLGIKIEADHKIGKGYFGIE